MCRLVQASFAASSTSEPLHRISPRAPFLVAASLSGLSFSACVVYAFIERSTTRLVAAARSIETVGTSTASKESEEESHRRTVELAELASFGDPFWCVLAFLVFCS
jgi:hypothetical protein